jgi:hypothetical protein
MNIFDLVLIFSVFVTLLGLLGMLFALVTRKWTLLRRLILGLVIYIVGYAILLVGVALLSPQQVLAMHQLRCFDDWCASVEQVEQQPAIGTVRAQGVFYLVTIQVTSQARRVSQRALDAAVHLLDDQGVRYDPSPQGQQALEDAGLAGQPLNSRVEAGGSFSYTAVFDVPSDTYQLDLVITHGAFPGLIIIGDPQSFLHKPTIVRISVP